VEGILAFAVTNARNFHTHWDPDAATAPTGADLWPICERLVVILEACFLAEMNISEEAVEQRIHEGNRAYRALEVNPAL